MDKKEKAKIKRALKNIELFGFYISNHTEQINELKRQLDREIKNINMMKTKQDKFIQEIKDYINNN